MWKYFQNNPAGRNVGDCAVRAVSVALGWDWEKAYCEICSDGFYMCDMPSSNGVWGATLRKNGFYRLAVPDTCSECYTAEDFCQDHKKGTFVLGFGNHVATVKDGILYDSWDSSQEIPQYYWYRKDRRDRDGF